LASSHLLANLPANYDEKWTRKIRTQITAGSDVAEVIQHWWVKGWLRDQAADGSLLEMSTARDYLWDIRNDLQYGPRLRKTRASFHFDSCKNKPEDIRPNVNRYIRDVSISLEEYAGSLEESVAAALLEDNYTNLFLRDAAGLWRYFGAEAQKTAEKLHDEAMRLLTPRVDDWRANLMR
jgi:hypothetical protein